jgi:hypothetical protein
VGPNGIGGEGAPNTGFATRGGGDWQEKDARPRAKECGFVLEKRND